MYTQVWVKKTQTHTHTCTTYDDIGVEQSNYAADDIRTYFINSRLFLSLDCLAFWGTFLELFCCNIIIISVSLIVLFLCFVNIFTFIFWLSFSFPLAIVCCWWFGYCILWNMIKKNLWPWSGCSKFRFLIFHLNIILRITCIVISLALIGLKDQYWHPRWHLNTSFLHKSDPGLVPTCASHFEETTGAPLSGSARFVVVSRLQEMQDYICLQPTGTRTRSRYVIKECNWESERERERMCVRLNPLGLATIDLI